MALVTVERRGAVLLATLADEPRRNALSAELVRELLGTLREAEEDPVVRVVVLTNAGRTFCAGGDLKRTSDADVDRVGPRPLSPVVELFEHIARSSKPYVGRVDGHCVGGGVGLVAVLDISIVAEDATLGFSEVRIGVAPAVISVVCLPKMRVADAREHFLRGDRFSAAEAVRMGLVNHAVARDGLDAAVDAVIGDLLAGSPAAIAASKRLIRDVPRLPADSAFEETAARSAALFASPDAQAGIAAFRTKSEPPWKQEWAP